MAGPSSTSPPVDQTSAVIAVLTVALVIVVETLRHQLDRSVSGRPFASNVVEHCYRELTTLGIVEFGVFIAHKVATNFDLDVEEKFAQAHMTLFLTAILYAFHMCLISFISFRLSGRWNEIEKMELDHYIEVRHAFERIKEELEIDTENGEDMNTFKNKTALYLRSPILARRYDRLLEQIRFHELRAYFLAANNLPKDFQLSVYLNHCQCNVLIHLVELTTQTWLCLLIIFTLFFYFATMEVSLDTRYEPYANLPITGFVFFEGGCLFVLLLGLLLKYKMDGIYQTMMHDSEMMQPKHINGEQPPPGTRFQIDLFWKRNPYLIVTFYQYMSFAYAVGASILLFYAIKDFTTNVLYITILTFMLSYCLNLLLVSYFMPRFTLCVSVGQLTDRATLNEALSDHRLKKLKDKAKKRRNAKSDNVTRHAKHSSKSSSISLGEKAVRFIDRHIRKTSNESVGSEESYITPPTKPKSNATPTVVTVIPAPIPMLKTSSVVPDPQEVDDLTPRTAEHINFLSNRFAVTKTSPRAAPLPPLPSAPRRIPPSRPPPLKIDSSSRASFRTSKLPATPQQYYSPHYANKRAHLADHHSKASIHWLDIASMATKPISELPSSQEKKTQETRPRRRKSISDTAKILMMSGVPKEEGATAVTHGSSGSKSKETESTKPSPLLRPRSTRSISDGVMAMCSPTAVEDLSSSVSPKRDRRSPNGRTPNSRSPQRHHRLQSVAEGHGMSEQPSPKKELPQMMKSPPQIPSLALNATLHLPADNSEDSSLNASVEIDTMKLNNYPISPYSPGDLSYNSATWHLSTLLEKFAAHVTRLFQAHWAQTSNLITISTVFTLALRAGYILQFGSSYKFAIMFDENNKSELLGTSFWFSFGFLIVLILEGLFQLIVNKRYILPCVDLPITVGSFVCLILSQTAGDMGGSFGTATPYSFNVFNYVPIILILRLKREDYVYIVERRYHSWDLHRNELHREKNITKSLLAQEKFETSRKLNSIDHASALIKSQHQVGTIVELWYAAMKDHPEVVQERGAFSGELLMAMLEIPEDPISQRNMNESGDTVGDSEDEEEKFGGRSRKAAHAPKASIDSFGSMELPPPSTSTTIFENASRRMPPLLVDWEDINVAVDSDRNDIRYFSINDDSYLGRINIDDIARITICEKGLRSSTVSASPSMRSPASTSALSPANNKSIQVMILLSMGSIVYIRFEDNELTTKFAALCGELTGLSFIDSVADKAAAHRRRISVKW